MRKGLVVLGVLLIISGAVLASIGNSSPTTRVVPERVADVSSDAYTKNWNVSGFLKENDRMVVELRLGGDWAYGQFEPDPEGSGTALLAVYVDILDPPSYNSTTKFEVLYAARNPEYGSGPPLALWKVNVLEPSPGLNTSSLLDVNSTTYAGIGGITQYTGMYTVNVRSLYPPREEPPSYIGIYKGVRVTDEPNNLSLPAGATVAVIGAVTSIFGLRASKPRGSSLRRKKT